MNKKSKQGRGTAIHIARCTSLMAGLYGWGYFLSSDQQRMTTINIKENILLRMGGEDVSAALKALPHIETATEAFQESDIDVPGIGKLRFACRRVRSSKHHKSIHVFWSATAAVKIE